jgi:hypothetical protein
MVTEASKNSIDDLSIWKAYSNQVSLESTRANHNQRRRKAKPMSWRLGIVHTVFGKIGQKDKQPMIKQCNRPIEEKKGSQHDSPMVKGV